MKSNIKNFYDCLLIGIDYDIIFWGRDQIDGVYQYSGSLYSEHLYFRSEMFEGERIEYTNK